MNQTSISKLQIGRVEFLSTFNIFLSIAASLGNALILVALHKETSLHPPTKRLFQCLAITDLCVGVISQPLFAVFLLLSVTTGMNGRFIFYIDKLYNASSFVLCQVSILTSGAISVDRLQALLSGLRYRHVVTLSRVRAVIICFWLIGISCGSMYFWNVNAAFTVSFTLKIISLATSVLSYSTIYLKLRQQQLQVHAALQGKPRGRQVALNIARYKKSVSSALWVQLLLVTCYIPYIVVRVMLMTYGQISGSKFEIARYVTATLIYLNSSLNPILYCWRIGAVRQAAKDTIKQLNCCKSD
ncbi:melanocortin receptor 5-like [Orbicella faveolata]|uniref:melanocortin receptor 5-like n=1 Tax=Orbicella faveolata TaxID=48498 RepID=UPI0009E3FC66|nr:melanocortin receptor 5-like [Orbicella faveolata]